MTATRQELAEAFRYARRQISPKYPKFICVALQTYCPARVGTAATEVIVERLGGAYTYETWVDRHFDDLARNILDDETRDQIGYESRLRWLDSLIEEFSC